MGFMVAFSRRTQGHFCVTLISCVLIAAQAQAVSLHLIIDSVSDLFPTPFAALLEDANNNMEK